MIVMFDCLYLSLYMVERDKFPSYCGLQKVQTPGKRSEKEGVLTESKAEDDNTCHSLALTDVTA